MDFGSYEMSSKVDWKHAKEPYTWSQIAERTIWKYLFLLVLYHVGCVLALASYAFGLHSVPMKWWTVLWNIVVGLGISFSISAGAHRLWSHRSYKARLPLRIMLMMFYSSAGVYPIYNWVRDHRVHHKYSDTEIDPHNPSRGFFFSHIGWLFMTRLPEALSKLRRVDMRDIEADSVVMFEKRYSGRLHLLLYLILPIAIPVTLWNETLMHAVLTQLFIRHVLFLHLALGVNSVGHLWGIRTYNRSINPADNKLLSLATLGEGSHNYHHTFPWDYKSSEDPWRSLNTTALFIELMAKIGLAYDLRGTSPEHIERVVNRIGYKSKINEDH